MLMSSKTWITVSFDFEAVHCRGLDELPVINMGFVAFDDETQKVFSELSLNLKAGEPDKKTLDEFWLKPENMETYKKCTENPLEPREAMKQLKAWVFDVLLKNYKRIQWLAYPTIYDGSLLYYYWFRYLGHPTGGIGPGFNMIDIRSYASGKLQIPYDQSSKRKKLAAYCPSADDFPHTHCGVDDAKEQGMLYFNIKNIKNN